MEYSGGMIKILKSHLITLDALLMTFWALACCKLNHSSGVAGLRNSGGKQQYNDNSSICTVTVHSPIWQYDIVGHSMEQVGRNKLGTLHLQGSTSYRVQGDW